MSIASLNSTLSKNLKMAFIPFYMKGFEKISYTQNPIHDGRKDYMYFVFFSPFSFMCTFLLFFFYLLYSLLIGLGSIRAYNELTSFPWTSFLMKLSWRETSNNNRYKVHEIDYGWFLTRPVRHACVIKRKANKQTNKTQKKKNKKEKEKRKRERSCDKNSPSSHTSVLSWQNFCLFSFEFSQGKLLILYSAV